MQSRLKFSPTYIVRFGYNSILSIALPLTVVNASNTSHKEKVASRDKIGFEPNEDTLLDESKANSIIAPYARDLNLEQYNDNDILIIGTSAKVGDASGCRELSLNRGRRIASKLVENGIDPSRIYVYGGGYETEFYCDDHGADGELLEYEAKKNRTVVLLSTKNEKSKGYLDKAVPYAN